MRLCVVLLIWALGVFALPIKSTTLAVLGSHPDGHEVESADFLAVDTNFASNTCYEAEAFADTLRLDSKLDDGRFACLTCVNKQLMDQECYYCGDEALGLDDDLPKYAPCFKKKKSIIGKDRKNGDTSMCSDANIFTAGPDKPCPGSVQGQLHTFLFDFDLTLSTSMMYNLMKKGGSEFQRSYKKPHPWGKDFTPLPHKAETPTIGATFPQIVEQVCKKKTGGSSAPLATDVACKDKQCCTVLCGDTPGCEFFSWSESENGQGCSLFGAGDEGVALEGTVAYGMPKGMTEADIHKPSDPDLESAKKKATLKAADVAAAAAAGDSTTSGESPAAAAAAPQVKDPQLLPGSLVMITTVEALDQRQQQVFAETLCELYSKTTEFRQSDLVAASVSEADESFWINRSGSWILRHGYCVSLLACSCGIIPGAAVAVDGLAQKHEYVLSAWSSATPAALSEASQQTYQQQMQGEVDAYTARLSTYCVMDSGRTIDVINDIFGGQSRVDVMKQHLQSLLDSGVRTFVITNGVETQTADALADAGLPFTGVIGRLQSAAQYDGKWDPGDKAGWIHSQLPPGQVNRVVLVDDDEPTIRKAHAKGMYTWLVPDAGYYEGPGLKPDIIRKIKKFFEEPPLYDPKLEGKKLNDELAFNDEEVTTAFNEELV